MSRTTGTVKRKRDLVELIRANPSSSGVTRIDDYMLLKFLGEGKYSRVMLAKHVDTEEEVAVKIISKGSFNNEDLDNFSREARIMKTLNHPNIIKLLSVIDTSTHIYFIMEYASGGDLFDYIQKHGCLTEKEARAMVRQIVSALEYCHQKKIVHRDLKDENILLDSQMNIKLADFGLSAELMSENKLEICWGSLPYLAPEQFRGEKYGFEVDVWALGILLYVLLTDTLLFGESGDEQVKQQVLLCKYNLPYSLSADCKTFLQKIFVTDPEKRPNLETLMKEKWLNHGYATKLKPYLEP